MLRFTDFYTHPVYVEDLPDIKPFGKGQKERAGILAGRKVHIGALINESYEGYYKYISGMETHLRNVIKYNNNSTTALAIESHKIICKKEHLIKSSFYNILI
jgi:hypothetical protein